MTSTAAANAYRLTSTTISIICALIWFVLGKPLTISADNRPQTVRAVWHAAEHLDMFAVNRAGDRKQGWASVLTSSTMGLTLNQFDQGSNGVCPVATCYYVSTTGSPSHDCTAAQDPNTPKLTIGDAVTNCVQANQAVIVRGGTYDEMLGAPYWSGSSYWPSGTSWSNKILIENYPNETVWIQPSTNYLADQGVNSIIWLDQTVGYIEFNGINLDGTVAGAGGLWVSTNNGNDPNHIRFANAEVSAGPGGDPILLGAHTLIGATGGNEIINASLHGGGLPGLCGFACNGYGIYVMGPNNLMDGLDIYDTGSSGIHIYNRDGDSPDNNIIRNTRIHDITRTGNLNEVWGVLIAGNNNQVYNNIIWNINVGSANPGNAAITIGNGYWSNLVANNTIYNDTNSGIYVGTGASGNTVANNIVDSVTGSAFVDLGSSDTFMTNACTDGSSFSCTVATSANFTNTGSTPPDLTVGSSSPVCGAGSDGSSVFTTDINGTTRTDPWGLGAYSCAN